MNVASCSLPNVVHLPRYLQRRRARRCQQGGVGASAASGRPASATGAGGGALRILARKGWSSALSRGHWTNATVSGSTGGGQRRFQDLLAAQYAATGR